MYEVRTRHTHTHIVGLMSWCPPLVDGHIRRFGSGKAQNNSLRHFLRLSHIAVADRQKSRNCHISETVWLIGIKFSKVTYSTLTFRTVSAVKRYIALEKNQLLTVLLPTPAQPPWVGRLDACLCVCLFVRALTGKQLELSTPNLVHVYAIAVARHVLTQRSKGQRSRLHGYENRTVARLLLAIAGSCAAYSVFCIPAWICMSIWLPKFSSYY